MRTVARAMLAPCSSLRATLKPLRRNQRALPQTASSRNFPATARRHADFVEPRPRQDPRAHLYFHLCSHCQDFTRIINPVARQYALRGVQFFECAINNGAETGLKQFVTQFQPAFPVGWATQEVMASFLGAMFGDPRAMLVPDMILLDRIGLVRSDFDPDSNFYTYPSVSLPQEL